MVTDAGEKLAAFERGLATLVQSAVLVNGSEAVEGDASVTLTFAGGAELRMDYWRLLRHGLSVLSSFDHQQKYGLPQPVDAHADLEKALQGQEVVEARLDRQTGDLLFAFSGRTHLQVFNLTGYEIWEIMFSDGTRDYSNAVLQRLYEAARP